LLTFFSQFISTSLDCLNALVCDRLILDNDSNEKNIYALQEEINELYLYKSKKFSVTDGANKPQFLVCDGFYKVIFQKSAFYVHLNENGATITSYFGESGNIQKFLIDICDKHCGRDNRVLFRTNNADRWGNVLPRPILKMNITKCMQEVLDDIKHFLSLRQEYAKNGHPFRKGYIIEGLPGVGKSSMASLIKQELDLNPYLVLLNNGSMNDAMLSDIISRAPPKSTIFFDEFVSQYETAVANPQIQISPAGILTAIDGPQRLNDCNIIILTCQSVKDIDPRLLQGGLIRPGRIDKVFTFYRDSCGL